MRMGVSWGDETVGVSKGRGAVGVFWDGGTVGVSEDLGAL